MKKSINTKSIKSTNKVIAVTHKLVTHEDVSVLRNRRDALRDAGIAGAELHAAEAALSLVRKLYRAKMTVSV